jgi:Pvc16 N-terminal domain
MSDYRVMSAVDETLRTLLWSRIQFDSEISSIIGTEQQITLEPPFKVIKDTDPEQESLSLYLYRLVENAELKNRPLERVNESALRYPPLPLNLFYLVTPLTNTTENDHKVLSKSMQIFHDHAIAKGALLQGVLQNTATELRIILNPTSMEDMSKLWSAFMRPQRLSVSYEVKVIYIDSERETGGEQVRRKRLEFTQFNGG